MCYGADMGRDASNSSDDRRVRMVRRQIESRGVRDPQVLAAMREVARERFVPERELQWAFDDHPLPIGRGRTISQPYIVALMTEALKIRPEHRVLEIGAGCGYQSAVLARLCRELCALERDPALAGRARATLEELGVENVDLRCGDGYCGWPEDGVEFDGILAACAADHVPQTLLDQLRAPGRMVLPLGEGLVQDLCLIERGADGDITRRSLGYVRFVPMVPGLGGG